MIPFIAIVAGGACLSIIAYARGYKAGVRSCREKPLGKRLVVNLLEITK